MNRSTRQSTTWMGQHYYFWNHRYGKPSIMAWKYQLTSWLTMILMDLDREDTRANLVRAFFYSRSI